MKRNMNDTWIKNGKNFRKASRNCLKNERWKSFTSIGRIQLKNVEKTICILLCKETTVWDLELSSTFKFYSLLSFKTLLKFKQV